MYFNAYGPNDPICAAPVFQNQVTADDNGIYQPSVPFTPTATGTYYWNVYWSGNDTNPAPAYDNDPCGPLNVSQTSLITPALPPPSGSQGGAAATVAPITPVPTAKKCKKRKRSTSAAKKRCKKKR